MHALLFEVQEIWGVRNVRCLIVYANMLLGARKMCTKISNSWNPGYLYSNGKLQRVNYKWWTTHHDMKMDRFVLEENPSSNMLGLTFSSKFIWGSYIISVAKTASEKIGALIQSMKFLSPEVALYLYKSTTWSCMEYCCSVWAGASVATWNC